MRVRRARVEDAGAIARVSVQSWRSAYRGLVPDAYLDALDVGERGERWRARLAAGDCTFVVEERGFAGYCRLLAHGEVRGLYVLPERQRGGLGSALLVAGLEELRARGGEAATLWVFEANHGARAFYARFGFVPDGAEGVDEGTGVDEIRLRVAL